MNLRDYPPIIDINGYKSHCNNGDIAFTYFLDLPEIYSLGDEDYDKMCELWYSSIKGLPPSIFHKQDFVIKESYLTDNLPEENFIQKARKKHFNGREYTYHLPVVHFIYTKKSILRNESIKSPFKKPYSIEDIKEFDADLQSFEQDINTIVEFINASNLIKLHKATEEDILQLKDLYYNGLNKNIITDTEVKGRDLFVGDSQVGAYAINSIKRLPASVKTCAENRFMSGPDYTFFKGFTESLVTDLPFNHVYNQIFYIEGHHKIKQKVVKNAKNLKGSEGFGEDNKIASQKAQDFTTKLADDEKINLHYGHFNVVFFSDQQYTYDQCQKSIESLFMQMEIKPYKPVGKSLLNIYYNSFFSNASNLDYDNTMTMDLQASTCLINHVGPYKSDNDGVYFTSRNNNIPIKRDIWDAKQKRIKARNFIITAATGNGKSFLSNYIIRQLIDQQYKVVINDLGDSYQKLGLLYPDNVKLIRFEPGKPLGINLFHIDSIKDLSTDKLNELINFIRIPWKGEGVLSYEEENSLRKILKTYYSNAETGQSFQQFYSFIEYNKEEILSQLELSKELFNIDSFLHNCGEFASDGSYEYLFQETNSTEYNTDGKQVVAFEYGEAQNDKLLLSMVLSMSSSTIRKNILQDKRSKGLVLFDEFGKQMKYPSVFEQVVWYNETIRKHEGMCGIVLQTPRQLPMDEFNKSKSLSLVENASVLYTLPGTTDYDAFKEVYKYQDHDLYQLKSMQNKFTGEVKYSEVHIKIGKNFRNVVHVETPEQERCAYLTEGSDHMKIMDYYEETKNMELAINKFINANAQNRL